MKKMKTRVKQVNLINLIKKQCKKQTKNNHFHWGKSNYKRFLMKNIIVNVKKRRILKKIKESNTFTTETFEISFLIIHKQQYADEFMIFEM